LAGLLKALGATLGLLQYDPESYLKGLALYRVTTDSSVPVEWGEDASKVDQLIDARNAARKAKNFAEADRIRKELDAAGILLEDRPGGVTEWRRK
jgi:cysteinyl-tRNA synthetase